MRFWPNSIKDLDEFAALISALDFVITVCNTTVHYAGGVGTPVWVMAPKVPEWRYGLYSTVLPWYPSSRIYRQQEHGEWLPSGLGCCPAREDGDEACWSHHDGKAVQPRRPIKRSACPREKAPKPECEHANADPDHDPKRPEYDIDWRPIGAGECVEPPDRRSQTVLEHK